MTLAGDEMANRLGEMAFSGPAGAGDRHGPLLNHETAGGQVVDQGAIEAGQAIEVETFQGFLAAEVGAAQPLGQLFLLAAGDFVLDQQPEEVGVGQVPVDGFAVAGLERIEDAGPAQGLEQGDEFG